MQAFDEDLSRFVLIFLFFGIDAQGVAFGKRFSFFL